MQDILFHRELGVPLADIARLLEAEGRDRLAILAEHRAMLADRVDRSRQLLRTIDRTIAELNGEGTMKDKDFYRGFSPEEQARHEEELIEQLGEGSRDEIETGKAHWAMQGDKAFQAALEQGGKAELALAEHFLAGDAPDAETAASALEQHRKWIGLMWGDRECPPDRFGGIADLYLSHPGFRERYEAHGTDFTDWLASAMKAHAARLEANG